MTSQFYEITVREEKFGYLLVHSDENESEIVGNLLAQSLKTRIAYELAEEFVRTNVSIDDQLVKELIKERDFDSNMIIELMKELKMRLDIPRIAILISSPVEFKQHELTKLKYRIEHKGTIQSLIDSKQLLIFKNLDSEMSTDQLKQMMNNFIIDLIDWGLNNCYYYVGSIQEKIQLYRVSYKNCQWVKQNIKAEKNIPIYFNDFSLKYLTMQLTTDGVFDSFYHYYLKKKEIDVDEMINIAESLYMNNYNVTQTAENLFLHKNTLIYKLKKYEDVFGIEIRKNFQDKVLFYLIANFYREEKRQKQVGVQL
uniref:PucR family transcriptional regulator n=1 Tax=Candidatus Enterococcus willemsii TaxID=1857215 RepID=UPI00403F95DE